MSNNIAETILLTCGIAKTRSIINAPPIPMKAPEAVGLTIAFTAVRERQKICEPQHNHNCSRCNRLDELMIIRSASFLPDRSWHWAGSDSLSTDTLSGSNSQAADLAPYLR